jgi:hypothetical protein
MLQETVGYHSLTGKCETDKAAQGIKRREKNGIKVTYEIKSFGDRPRLQVI